MARAAVPTKRREKTRARLIEAATAVVAENGFHAASVDQIAERAGFSVGALYSNFSGKDDLLFAVFDGHIEWFSRRLETLAAAPDPAQGVADWIGILAAESEQFLVFIEFWAYAVRKPKVRRQFAKRMDQLRTDVAAAIERQATERGTEPPLGADFTALLTLAIGRGLALEKLVRPGSVPDRKVGDLLASLAG